MSTPTLTLLEHDGMVVVKDTDSDVTPEKDVLSGPCVIENIHCENGDASTNYLKLYDDLSPDVGTDDPDYILTIPSSAVNNGFIDFPGRFVFKNGCSYATVTTAGTAGITSPTGNTTVVLKGKKGVS